MFCAPRFRLPFCASTRAVLAKAAPARLSVAPASTVMSPVAPSTPPLAASVPPLARTRPVLLMVGVTVPKPLTVPALASVPAAKLPPAICSVPPSWLVKLPAPAVVKVLLPPTLTMPALLKLPSVVKLRPLRMVKLPAAALVAKLARALVAPLLLRKLEPTPSSRMVAALVTTLAPVNWNVPGPMTLYVPPVSVVPAKLLSPVRFNEPASTCTVPPLLLKPMLMSVVALPVLR